MSLQKKSLSICGRKNKASLMQIESEMEQEKSCCCTQLIDGNGVFNVEGLENFIRTTKLSQCDLSYAVVAIMGPQSSGKSTLLNHLFHTNFREMDANRQRSQTTKGVWIAKCVGIEPFTVAMDLEGADGSERGEDDTAFEKQSALFALAVADIILINMWCHDIGREHAASKPLLKTVFQVMLHLFSPRKTTLMFVIRDKTKTHFEHLELPLRKDIEKIWAAVEKPEAHKSAPLSEFFNVEVTALSSYEDKEERFKEQVAQRRQRFFNSIVPEGLAGDRRGVVPASGFSFSAQKIWKAIRENKDLDLPTHKVIVATFRCEEIANEKFNCLTSDKRWLELEAAVQAGPVSGFGEKVSSILGTYFLEYENETRFFDEGVRKAKQQQLESKALDVVHRCYLSMLGHLRSKALESFKTRLEQLLNKGERFAASVRACAQSCMLDFDKGCEDAAVKQSKCNASKIREKLIRDLLSELVAKYEKQLADELAKEVDSLFVAGRADTWASIRNHLQRKTEFAESEISNVIVSFELNGSITDTKLRLRDYARNVVERKAREAAASGTLLIRMNDRFMKVFSHDENSKPRVWSREENIDGIERNALIESLKILSIMAAIRLDEKPDNIENALFCSLMGGNAAVPSSGPFIPNTWEGVPPNATLLSPEECISLWMQFKEEIKNIVTQARTTQETRQKAHTATARGIAAGAGMVLGAAGLVATGGLAGLAVAVASPEVAATAAAAAVPAATALTASIKSWQEAKRRP